MEHVCLLCYVTKKPDGGYSKSSHVMSRKGLREFDKLACGKLGQPAAVRPKLSQTRKQKHENSLFSLRLSPLHYNRIAPPPTYIVHHRHNDNPHAPNPSPSRPPAQDLFARAPRLTIGATSFACGRWAPVGWQGEGLHDHIGATSFACGRWG